MGQDTIPEDDQLHTQTLQHLGLVMATIRHLGLIDKIDQRLPIDPAKGAKVSMGQRVSAMILNGLGFMDDRLYMFPEFLEDYPVQRFFGPDVKASHFNDDALGRCLDAIHTYGVTKLFSEIAFEVGTEHGLLGKTARLDTTSLIVYGEYTGEEGEEQPEGAKAGSQQDNSLKETPFQPAYGYSKDGRPDLKQVILNLATTGKANLPIWMSPHSGNASDKVVLQQAAERMKTFADALKEAPSFLFVGDSAMYEACVEKGGSMLWLSRVPHTNTAAKDMLVMRDEELTWVELEKGYKVAVMHRTYKEVKQRWLLVSSQQGHARDQEALQKRLGKEKETVEKKLWHLGAQVFTCEKDADKAIKPLAKDLIYHTLTHTVEEVRGHKGKGRPKAGAVAEMLGYKVVGLLKEDEGKIAVRARTCGRFILATNQMDTEALKDAEMLLEYKQQLHTEMGFRFIKDDTFEVSNIFLKKASRIQALMMVMTLCLMVYNLAQHRVREALVTKNETIPDQLKKPTQKPTMERVCRLFRNVHVVLLPVEGSVRERVSNMNALPRQIIGYFGVVAERIYGLSP